MSDSYCPLHPHVFLKGRSICRICTHRESYMVRGNVNIFDEGFTDGFNGRDSRIDIYGKHQSKADYQDGYEFGIAERPGGARKPGDAEFMQLAAEALQAKLPDGHAFLLLVVPYGEGGFCRSASSMDRESAINAMKEYLIKASGEEEWMKHIK